MSIDGVSGRTSYIGTSIIGLRNQLNDLTQQLASGRISTTYAGQGANRGFALSLRAQVSSIDAFADTLIAIAAEARRDPEVVRTAPHTAPVKRLDEAMAARQPNLRWRGMTGSQTPCPD